MKKEIDRILMELCFLEEAPMPAMTLKEELGLDSLRLVELMVALEEALGVQLEESDLDPAELVTVGDVYRLAGKYEATREGRGLREAADDAV